MSIGETPLALKYRLALGSIARDYFVQPTFPDARRRCGRSRPSIRATEALFRPHARGDRRGDGRGHLELRGAVLDLIAARDPGEVRVNGLNRPIFVLPDEGSHWPVETGVRIGGEELGAKRRIAEDQQRGRAKFEPASDTN
jgi:hypothetical protein